MTIEEWRRSGRLMTVLGREVFVRDSGDGATTVVVVHGFPGSSYDWAGVVPLLHTQHRMVTFDLPGFGFSDKDPRASYSLFDQASAVEALLDQLGVGQCVLLAHDMGNTVTAELAARHNAGALGFEPTGIILTNGSIFIDMAQLTRGQRLTLRLPARALPFALPTVVLRRSLNESFTRECPPPPGAIDALVDQIRRRNGDRLIPVLIRYVEERRRHQDHWTAGFVDYAGPLSMIWGERDPIAVLAMTDRLEALRPGTTVVTLPGVGHWPSIEAPELLAAHVRAVLGS